MHVQIIKDYIENVNTHNCKRPFLAKDCRILDSEEKDVRQKWMPCDRRAKTREFKYPSLNSSSFREVRTPYMWTIG